MLMMIDVFRDSVPERRFAKENHAVKAFLFDRPNKPLGEGIEIWTAGGQRNRFDADGAEDHIESGKLKVTRVIIQFIQHNLATTSLHPPQC